MDITFLIGIIGGLVLVAGAAWPVPQKLKHPTESTKNRLLLVGSLIMFLFTRMGYYSGSSIFFLVLELFIVISCILMMLNINDKINTIILSASGLALVVRSFYLFQGYTTLIFIVGLVILGLGYAFKTGSLRRDIALTLGSAFVAWFSLLEPNRIFFGLNLFFAIFSGYYLWKNIKRITKQKL